MMKIDEQFSFTAKPFLFLNAAFNNVSLIIIITIIIIIIIVIIIIIIIIITTTITIIMSIPCRLRQDVRPGL